MCRLRDRARKQECGLGPGLSQRLKAERLAREAATAESNLKPKPTS